MKALASQRDVFLKVFGFLIILGLWELAAYIIRLNFEYWEVILPSLRYVFKESLPNIAGYGGAGMGKTTQQGFELYLTAIGVLVINSLYTLLKIFGGLIGGLIIGIGLGLLVGWNEIIRRIIFPPIEFIRQTPLLALLTLFILWFGGKEIGIYLYIMYGVTVMIFVNTVNAVRNVPSGFIQFAKTLGADRGRIYSRIIMPSIVPELVGGIRVIIGVVWAIGMAGEYFMAQKGLGRIMIMSEYFQLSGQMIVIVFLYILFAFSTDKIVVKITSRLLRWAPTLRNV